MTARLSYRRGPRRVACSVVHQIRYSAESVGWAIPAGLARHQASCLHCQADAGRHRLIMRGLTELRAVIETMPYDLAEVFERGELSMRRTRPHRSIYDDGRYTSRAAIASAASLAAIGVAVVARRRLRSAS